MKKRTALIVMFWLLGAVAIFHVLILTGYIPFDQVWAGRLQSVEEMRRFETFSLLVNLFMLSILWVKYQHIQAGKNNQAINILIWIFCGFFLLNTLGNLFAKSIWELVLGTAFTLAASILCFIIAKR